MSEGGSTAAQDRKLIDLALVGKISGKEEAGIVLFF
jgi:hypothetical protein